MKKQQVTRAIARKVLATVDQGLSKGLGKNVPGQMCVEAAVCYAYGLPHGDDPPCVGPDVRTYKINLNDLDWSTPAARAQGMRALAIAQLGSAEIDQAAFCAMLQEGTIRVIVPIALRAAAALANPTDSERLLAAAQVCEDEGTVASARAANANATAYATANAYANAYATAAATAYATANAYATVAATAAATASAAANAYANAYATAAATASAAANAKGAARDEVLAASADVCLQCLYALGSPGCAFLDLLQ